MHMQCSHCYQIQNNQGHIDRIFSLQHQVYKDTGHLQLYK